MNMFKKHLTKLLI